MFMHDRHSVSVKLFDTKFNQNAVLIVFESDANLTSKYHFLYEYLLENHVMAIIFPFTYKPPVIYSYEGKDTETCSL